MSLVAPGSPTTNPIGRVPIDLNDQSYSHPLFGNIQNAQFTDVSDIYGNLQPEFQSQMDTTGLDMLRDQSLSGETPWLNPAMKESGVADLYAQQDAAKQTSKALYRPGSTQQAMNSIGGAGQINQGVRQQQGQNAYQLMGQANTAAANNLQSQVGRDISAMQPQNFNISQGLQERTLKDQSAYANWSEQMRTYAARQQAQAQLDAGGDGGMLGFMG